MRGFLKKLGDFEEDDAIECAFSHAEASGQIYAALAFFIAWPRLDRGATLVLAKAGKWDGRHYGPLSDAAAALEEKFPLAASVLYRALLDDILARGKSQSHGHCACYLAKLETLAAEIPDWGRIDDQVAYALGLQKSHGRKYGFWSLTEAKPKR